MELLPWFALKEVPGIGNLLFSRLLERFKSPDVVFNTHPDRLTEVKGVSSRLARAICEHQISDRAKRSLETSLGAGLQIITRAHAAYPALLQEIPDPPPLIQVAGTLQSDSAAVAIVGSRKGTTYGLDNATHLAKTLAISGFSVVSGLARGIDTAAHTGALNAGGHTIAVMGCGLGTIYPPENYRLAHAIAESGALISEWDYEVRPEAHHFPMRNRIISGLSLGTVVVEASLKSGSLITARCAAEQNRDVFAVPGHIKASQSAGTHRLIQEGAKLVTSASDIIDEFSALIHKKILTCTTDRNCTNNESFSEPPSTTHENFPLDNEETSVLKVLDLYPSHIDDILQHLPMDAGRLSAVLLNLELKGMVNRSPGKLFSLKEEKT